MAELKAMFSTIGFKNPITYIQSGNVIFDSEIEDVEIIESLISKAILHTFGHEVPVLVKKALISILSLIVIPFIQIQLIQNNYILLF